MIQPEPQEYTVEDCDHGQSFDVHKKGWGVVAHCGSREDAQQIAESLGGRAAISDLRDALETIAYGRKGADGLRYDWTSWQQQGADSQAIAREALAQQARLEEVEVKPSVGRIVHYVSRNGDGIVSPAIVLRTRASTNLEVIERWGPSPDGTLSGKGRPADLVAELPDDETVDLLCHGLGGDYREYAVPMQDESPFPCGGQSPRTWHWPEREE